MWSGRFPYVDLFDNKPPLSYFLLAPIHLVAPRSLVALSLVSVFFTALTAIIIAFWIPVVRTSTQRAVFAVTLALLLNAPFVEGAAFNTEQVMSLFVAASIAVAIHVRSHAGSPPSSTRAIASGALMCLAVLSKQVGVLFVPISFLILLVGTARDPRPGPQRLKVMALYAAGGLLPAGVVISVYALLGGLRELWFDVVQFGIQYSKAGQSESLTRYLPPSRPLLIFVVLGIAVSVIAFLEWIRRHDVLSATLVAWFVAALAGAQIGGRNFFHYYAPAVAPAVSLAALLLVTGDRSRSLRHRVIRLGCASAVILVALMSIQEIARPRTQPKSLDDEAAVATFIAAHRHAGDRLHVVGNAPEIYFRSGLPAATRFPYDIGGPLYANFRHEIEAYLTANPPRYYVTFSDGDASLIRPILSRYSLILTSGKVNLLELTRTQ